MKVNIKNFKKISEVTIDLSSINVFIGTNNSGKSSFIQGIQFAISSCQTLQLQNTIWRKVGTRTSNLESSDFLFTPTRHIDELYHGERLTGARKRSDRKLIHFGFDDGFNKCSIEISRGKNGGFTTVVSGKILGDELSEINNPYCVYVPGIAGIPVQEKYEVSIAVKKSATRGDSNNYLRNILYVISKDENKWHSFTTSVEKIYPDSKVNVRFEEDKSEYIVVYITHEGLSLPIDSIGTGLLQVIQVFAYIEYFSPKIILLDEPDAHIHPTKQKLLALEIVKRANENKDLKVIFSTHSRYILEALENDAKVFNFQNGQAIPDVKGSKILLDIGAADADYLFSKKDLKYVIVTEDKVDNINDKKNFLNKFLLANGLQADEFVLHSYEGSSKVDFAKILKNFVQKQIPGVEVILHIDRDQRVETDRDLEKLKTDCESRGILLFITEFSEIENYFVQPKHIEKIYGLTTTESNVLYIDLILKLKEETLRKTTNFILRDRLELGKNKNNQIDIALVESIVDDWYKAEGEFITPGKEMLGLLKNYIQDILKKQPNDILNISEGLMNERFKELLE